MPPIKNVRELKEKAQGRNFLNNGYEPYTTVQTFTRNLMELQNKLIEEPGQKQFAERVGKYANALMTLQMNGDAGVEPRLGGAIEQMGDLPNFLNQLQTDEKGKTGYERLVEAGEKYQVFTRAELDNALTLVSQGMQLGLELGEQKKEEPQKEEPKKERPFIPYEQRGPLMALEENLRNSRKEYYMPQRELPTSENERLSDKKIEYLNRMQIQKFSYQLGIDFTDPEGKVPETDGVPRLFILDENEPTNPRSLNDMNVKAGSRQFWELAQQGKMFAFPAGSKEAVQVYVMNRGGGQAPELFVTGPLSRTGDKEGDEYIYNRLSQPIRRKDPPEVKAPGFFARLLNRINSNWFKKENEEYQNYIKTCEQNQKEFDEKSKAYEKDLAESQEKSIRLGNKMDKALKGLFAGRRDDMSILQELADHNAALKEANKGAEQRERESLAKIAQQNVVHSTKGLDNLPSLFGPKPAPLQEYLQGQQYTKESFKDLKEINLEGMKIGDVQVDDKLFANIAFNATLDINMTADKYKKSKEKDKLGDPYVTYAAEGMSKKEIDEAIVFATHGLMVSDLCKPDLRSQFDHAYFNSEIKPGREKAEKALQAYKDGDLKPLAEIIVNAADNTVKTSKHNDCFMVSSLAEAKLTTDLLKVLDYDDSLKKKAEDLGLTEDKINVCKGLDYARQLREKSLKAEADLAKAGAGQSEMTQAEKEKCLRDIFKYRTAEAIMYVAERQENFPELDKTVKEMYTRSDNRQPAPFGKEPTSDQNIADILNFHLRPKMVTTPQVIFDLKKMQDKEIAAHNKGKEPKPNNLDKLADMTVKDMGLDEKDPATLANMLANGRGTKQLQLAEEQGKIMEKQKEQPAELEKQGEKIVGDNNKEKEEIKEGPKEEMIQQF